MYFEKIDLGSMYQEKYSLEDCIDHASFDEATGYPKDADFWKERTSEHYQALVKMKRKIDEQKKPAYGFFNVYEFTEFVFDLRTIKNRVEYATTEWPEALMKARCCEGSFIYAVDEELYNKVIAYLRTTLPWEEKRWPDRLTKED